MNFCWVNMFPNASGSLMRIGFLGSGKMATALARGIIASGIADSQDVLSSDPLEAAREAFAAATGAESVEDNEMVAQQAEVLICAVKPQHAPGVLAPLEGRLEGKLLISIMAGIKLDQLRGWVGEGVRLARAMPNTPALIGQGASGFVLRSPEPQDADLVQRLLSACGLALELKDEALLDGVTGVSGSGPAYVYQFIEALSDGGVLMGLPRDVATRLAAQTLYGAAAMVLETGQHPGPLKDAVTSPGGTTIAALEQLEQRGFRGAVISAVRAASEKARELSQ